MDDTDFKNTLIRTLRCKKIQMEKKEQIVWCTLSDRR